MKKAVGGGVEPPRGSWHQHKV